MDYYIGQIGIKPATFWSQTFAENRRVSEAAIIAANREWEHTRYIAAMVHNVQCQKQSQMKKPSDLIRLPTDEQTINKPRSTREQYEAFKKIAEAAQNKEQKIITNFGKK